MKNATFRFIIVLVAMLFLNIEAAQAGLIQRLRVFVDHEFPNQPIRLWVLAGVLTGLLLYVIFSPIVIGREKWTWIKLFRFQPTTRNYRKKRASITRISEVLQSTE